MTDVTCAELLLQSIEVTSNLTLFLLLVLAVKISRSVGVKLGRCMKLVVGFCLSIYFSLATFEVFFTFLKPLFVVYDIFSFLGLFIVGSKVITEFRRTHLDVIPEKNYPKMFLLFLVWVLLVAQLLKIDVSVFLYCFLRDFRYLLMAFLVNYLRVIILKTHNKILSFSITVSVYFISSLLSFHFCHTSK